MKLAEEIIIVLAGEAVELRPSLRHAIRLERREGSFRQLITDINEGSLTAAFDIIAPHADDAALLENRIFDVLENIRPALLEYVVSCAGLDNAGQPSGEAEQKSGKEEKPRSFADYLQDLYRHATGWLGWTPEQALNATPAEITLAFEGHIQMLRAVHGAAEPEKPKDTRPLNEKFRSMFAEIGTRKVDVEPAPEIATRCNGDA